MSANSEWWRVDAPEKELETWLAYAKRGFYVFPVYGIGADGRCMCADPQCAHPGKHPRVRDWENAASCDPTVITEWLKRWPRSNIGWAIGRSGLCALDVDPRNGGDESFAQLERTLGLIDTMRQQTGGGGEQHFLRIPPGVALRCRNNAFGDDYPGVDFKFIGGYVIGPPSRHASGGVYAWDGGSPQIFQELPQAWVDALLAQQNGARGGRKTIPGIDDDSRVGGGARHQQLLTFSGRCARAGMNTEQIFAALVAYSKTCFIPPHSDAEIAEELRRIGESAFAKYGNMDADALSCVYVAHRRKEIKRPVLVSQATGEVRSQPQYRTPVRELQAFNAAPRRCRRRRQQGLVNVAQQQQAQQQAAVAQQQAAAQAAAAQQFRLNQEKNAAYNSSAEAENHVRAALAEVRNALAPLERVLSEPPSRYGLRSQYAAEWNKMLGTWAQERAAAQETPMACYQKGNVTYIGSEVAYENFEVKYLDS